MPTLKAYLESLRHRHDWQPLCSQDHRALEFCPGCGAVREAPEAAKDD